MRLAFYCLLCYLDHSSIHVNGQVLAQTLSPHSGLFVCRIHTQPAHSHRCFLASVQRKHLHLPPHLWHILGFPSHDQHLIFPSPFLSSNILCLLFWGPFLWNFNPFLSSCHLFWGKRCREFYFDLQSTDLWSLLKLKSQRLEGIFSASQVNYSYFFLPVFTANENPGAALHPFSN